jgi:Ca-activated chloride channel family protein
MRFLRPDQAHWGLVVPLLVGFWVIHRQLRSAFLRRAPIAPRFAPLSRRTTSFRAVMVLLLAVLASGSIVFALVRPQALLTLRVPEYERQDLVIMLDRSVSMNARDIRPSRFSRATLEIRNFVRQKPEGIDRIALIGFADAAVVLSYLTRDLDSVLFFFDWIESDPTPLFGTNIGAALRSAMDVASKDDRPTRKVFLIVSDGEDYGTELRRALRMALADGYRVNTIGIGAADPVPIPVRTPEGGESFLRDDSGRNIVTRFSENTLREIAAVTGGRYVRSTTGAELQRALAEIAAGERRMLGYRTVTQYRDLHLLALAIAGLAGLGLWVLI